MRNRNLNNDPAFTTVCEWISAERERLFDSLKTDVAANVVTCGVADEFMAGMNALEARTTALKDRFYPRYNGRLIIGGDAAILVSPTGRSSHYVWKAGTR